MENLDDLEKFKKQLEYKASLPDVDFAMKLKSKLLKENSRITLWNRISRFFDNYSLNYTLAFNLLIVILLLGTGLYVAFNTIFLGTPSTTSQSKSFTNSSAEQEIISNVIKNNPLILLQDTTQAISLNEKSSEDVSMNTTIKTITDNDLIYRIVMNSNLGPQSTYCLDSSKQPKKVDLLNYSSKDGGDFYFKSVATDNDEKIINYYLNDSKNEIFYIGEENAYKYNLSSNISPTNEITAIQDMVKGSLDLESIISIERLKGTDNVEFIKIKQQEKNSLCTPNMNFEPIISTITIDPNTYKVQSKSYYIGSELDENLVIRYEFQTYTYLPDDKLILEEFNYNLDYPLIDLDLTN
jgi:hypothetical protein